MTNRQPYIVVGAVVGVVAIAALIVVLVILLRGDDDPGELVAVATSTVGPEAAGSPVPVATPPAGTTPTPEGAGGADEALEAFIAEEFASDYFGECPQEGVEEGEPVPTGICSVELHRGEDLVTFLVGALQSEGIGEAVIVRSEDGSWSVTFVDFGPLGETVALGSEAVVYGAGSCLNFRDSPSVSGAVQSCRIDSTTGEIVEGPQEADGHTWWRLDGLGWASEQFLRPVE